MEKCLIGWFLMAATIAGAQDLSFSIPPANVTGTYSPDTGLTVVSTMTIGHSGRECSYFITFSAGNSGVFTGRTAKSGSNKLNYQIYDNMTNQDALEDLTASPSSNNVLSGSFSHGNHAQVQTFTSYFAPNQLPVAGTHTDSLTMNIYIGTIARHGASVANQTFSVGIAVLTLLDIAIVPTGSPFNVAGTSPTLNFGTLSTGQVLSADFMVRSNYLNTVKVTSTNGQILQNGISGDTSQIPYTFAFNGLSVTLPKATAVNVITSQAATPAAGKRYPMSFTIGSFGFVRAATYTDNITFTATSN